MTTELIKEYGYRLLPFLVEAARTRKIHTYGEMAAKIDVHHRVLNNVLGFIRDEICIPNKLPFINAIVINADTRLPGDSWLPEGTSHLSADEYKHEFEKFRDEVFAYPDWEVLLNKLGLQPVEPTPEDLDQRGLAYTEFLERRGGGGEAEGHLQLKEYIAAHPQEIGLNPAGLAQKEFLFIAGDRADILFNLGVDGWAVVEIKNGDVGELVKGVYQLVKYRALLQAQEGHGSPILVHTVLVAYEIPSEISMFASKFGIRCRIVKREKLMMGMPQ